MDHLSELPAAAREHYLDAPPAPWSTCSACARARSAGSTAIGRSASRTGGFGVLWVVRVWLGEPLGLLGSASRMVVEPGLQVARHCEIEQVFRQLLQLLQGER